MEKIKNWWGVGIVVVVGLLVLSGCSGGQTMDEEDAGALLDEGAAQTDAVPQDNAEQPQDPYAENSEQAPPPEATPPPVDNPPPVADMPPPPPPPIAEASPAPTPAAEPSSNSNEWVMKEDDTLMKVAFEVYGNVYKWRKVYEMNKEKISDPDHVPPGTVLAVEGRSSIERNGEKYLITAGDTLGRISSKLYNTPRKWKALWKNNKQLIKDPDKIYAGFYLYYLPNPPMDPADEEVAAPQPLAEEPVAAPAIDPAAAAPPPADPLAAPASAAAPTDPAAAAPPAEAVPADRAPAATQ